MIGKLEEKYTYNLLEELARGGMGIVYKAELLGIEGFKKIVAIKTILDKYVQDRDFAERFLGEGKLVANLIHHNIVQIYQMGRFGEGYYIAMEYINGWNLQQFCIRHEEVRKEIPLDIAVFMISRICRGLEYAHNKKDEKGNRLGIVHRDINPKNIMLVAEGGQVKVTDFGIAKAANFMKDEEGEVIMGKVEYMSPEQARYEKTDRRSDIFSLGIVFYELLTGVNPFYSPNIRKALEYVQTKEIPDPTTLNPEIPESLEKIILKMLERDLDKRYQNAGEIGYDLEYYLYHNRYGPTMETLSKYLLNLFGRDPAVADVTDSTTIRKEFKEGEQTVQRKKAAEKKMLDE